MKDDLKVESSSGTETAGTMEVLVSMPDRKIKVRKLHVYYCLLNCTRMFCQRLNSGP